MDESSKVEIKLQIFKRQYLQLVEFKDLLWPPKQCLRLAKTQAWLFQELFDQDASKYLPPDRYQLRVLKQLLEAIEASIEDPEEDVGIPSPKLSLVKCNLA
jgi:hypothetical protein